MSSFFSSPTDHRFKRFATKMAMVALTTALLLGVLHVQGLLGMDVERYHDYCVVGAGPGGLQLGYFLERAGRDYVIFERNNVPGSFYVKYPRHRTLISINKRNTGQTNKEFNLRHDWNSLVSDDESLLFSRYTKEMFPNADFLLDYLRDYQRKLGIKVQFNTEISNIRKKENSTTLEGHVFLMEDQNNVTYTCRTLVLATGIATPVIPDLKGVEHTIGYEDLSVNPEDYEGKNVLIFGRGNAAFEVASSIYGHTNLIHMVARSRARLSWATHYVGDLRAVNNALLDTYQLKSLDGLLETAIDNTSKILRLPNGKLKFAAVEQGENTTALLAEIVSMKTRYAVLDNDALRDNYDVILRCMGFTFDNSIFANAADMVPTKLRGRKKKYPAIYHDYRSVDTPGLYIAGTASHSLDHRKSAGGFIHGFRYTARSLFHLLSWRYDKVRWPSTRGSITQLMSHVFKRLNEGSGNYQMFSVLGDVIALNSDKNEYEYFEEVPVKLLHRLENVTGITGSEFLVMVLEYGKNFSRAGRDVFSEDRARADACDAHQSNFLHPVFYHYKKLPTFADFKKKSENDLLPRPDFMHHTIEDFLAFWNAPVTHHLPFRRFLEHVTQKDLRNYYDDNCFRMALTHTSVPVGCDRYMDGQGLPGTKSLLQMAVVSGTFA